MKYQLSTKLLAFCTHPIEFYALQMQPSCLTIGTEMHRTSFCDPCMWTSLWCAARGAIEMHWPGFLASGTSSCIQFFNFHVRGASSHDFTTKNSVRGSGTRVSLFLSLKPKMCKSKRHKLKTPSRADRSWHKLKTPSRADRISPEKNNNQSQIEVKLNI